jgi:hypothetical protein
MSDYTICAHCGLSLHPGESIQHYGLYNAHRESRCIELLQSELAEARRYAEALRARQFKPYPDGPMPGPFGWEVKS